MKHLKQSETYGQISTGLIIAASLAFPFSVPVSAALMALVAASLLAGLYFHRHDE